jgi:hypothetical protein
MVIFLFDFAFQETRYSIIPATPLLYFTGARMKNSTLMPFSVLLLVTMLACSAVSSVTATPAPIKPPSPTSTPNPVLFEDTEFTDCAIDSTTDVERFVENGKFNMRVITPLYVAWSECAKTEFTDFIMEVDATQVSGPDNNTYGVVFRYGLDASEFYAFLISGDGFYVFTVDGPDRKEPELLVDWTESSAINKGAQTNHIKVVAVGESMKYYINDQLLGEVQDARFSAGTVGFFAGTLKEGNVQVSFDNLKISQP